MNLNWTIATGCSYQAVEVLSVSGLTVKLSWCALGSTGAGLYPTGIGLVNE